MSAVNNFLALAHEGIRVTLGATADLIETIQDPQKRTETLSQLRTEWSQKARQWAAKGEQTERAAHQMVETMLHQQNQDRSTTTTTVVTTATSVNSSARAEIQALTAEITALRAELEELQADQNPPIA